MSNITYSYVALQKVWNEVQVFNTTEFSFHINLHILAVFGGTNSV
jgi:hypothetical protein